MRAGDNFVFFVGPIIVQLSKTYIKIHLQPQVTMGKIRDSHSKDNWFYQKNLQNGTNKSNDNIL